MIDEIRSQLPHEIDESGNLTSLVQSDRQAAKPEKDTKLQQNKVKVIAYYINQIFKQQKKNGNQPIVQQNNFMLNAPIEQQS